MRLVCLAAIAALVATPAFAQQRGALQMLEAMDANGDGAITRAEVQAGRVAVFNRLDVDHDGYISATERDAANAQAAQINFANADGNHDGRVSRVELDAQPFRGFDRIDQNHDGVLSAQELRIARLFMRR